MDEGMEVDNEFMMLSLFGSDLAFITDSATLILL